MHLELKSVPFTCWGRRNNQFVYLPLFPGPHVFSIRANGKHGWTEFVFNYWFDELFLPFVRLKHGTTTPILLLLDNAPAHDTAFTRENVTVIPLPVNTTSVIQPMDMGIIAAFKKRYKYLLCEKIVDFFLLTPQRKQELLDRGKAKRRGAAGLSDGFPAHLRDCAILAQQAWDFVSLKTIQHCF